MGCGGTDRLEPGSVSHSKVAGPPNLWFLVHSEAILKVSVDSHRASELFTKHPDALARDGFSRPQGTASFPSQILTGRNRRAGQPPGSGGHVPGAGRLFLLGLVTTPCPGFTGSF